MEKELPRAHFSWNLHKLYSRQSIEHKTDHLKKDSK